MSISAGWMPTHPSDLLCLLWVGDGGAGQPGAPERLQAKVINAPLEMK